MTDAQVNLTPQPPLRTRERGSPIRTAIVLDGHGSHIAAATAGTVWDQVDALRKLGVVDEVTAAFWKEQPSFNQVFRSLTATDITIAPLFTAHGYFTQTVIPTEMSLTGSITVRDGRTIRYARTLGDHPQIGELVRSRVMRAIGERPADQIAVAILGHSTRRNPESRKATEMQVDQIRAAGLAREVVALFLDDTPGIEQVYELTSAPIVVAVPYFLASGSHAAIDVPARLGLPPGSRLDYTGERVRGRTVIYTPPIGEDRAITNMIVDLAREAGAPLYPARSGNVVESPWTGFPTAGRAELWQAVRAQKIVQFGQLEVTPIEVRPIAHDQQGDPTRPDQCVRTPDALRRVVRGTGDSFRPLATSDDLPANWYVSVDSAEQMHAIVETVYPGAVADWAAEQQGSLPVHSLDQVTARQSGLYRKLSDLNPEQREGLALQICGRCVRQPTWFDHAEHPDKLPCAEPCNWWMSAGLSLLMAAESA